MHGHAGARPAPSHGGCEHRAAPRHTWNRRAPAMQRGTGSVHTSHPRLARPGPAPPPCSACTGPPARPGRARPHRPRAPHGHTAAQHSPSRVPRTTASATPALHSRLGHNNALPPSFHHAAVPRRPRTGRSRPRPADAVKRSAVTRLPHPAPEGWLPGLRRHRLPHPRCGNLFSSYHLGLVGFQTSTKTPLTLQTPSRLSKNKPRNTLPLHHPILQSSWEYRSFCLASAGLAKPSNSCLAGSARRHRAAFKPRRALVHDRTDICTGPCPAGSPAGPTWDGWLHAALDPARQETGMGALGCVCFGPASVCSMRQRTCPASEPG